ncbi:MAG: methyltransferase domain-containing protein, partial [Saprospiraceae bacterium]|nr:methyltransferase domain-containing protein [Saprospiraceae bacterium]
KKLDLKSSDKVLDIGCGWGGFVKFAAEQYGCNVTGITISDEQLAYAKAYCKDLPVKLIKLDYRDLSGKYDKILICGMIEHVGSKNYRRIMKIVRRSLNESGKFLLHTIGNKVSARTTDPWISRYIFPHSLLPSMKQISQAAEGLFIMEDWQNFGAYYDQTLMAWHKNFKKNWESIKANYDERFYRMWEYYLLTCAGSFRARENQLWRVVFTTKGQPGVFQYLR